jgi:hypothetical protein
LGLEVTYAPATPAFVDQILADLRPSDREEIVMAGRSPADLHEWGTFPNTFIALLDGEPVAIFGVAGEEAPFAPWMLGTSRVDSASKTLHGVACEMVEAWKANYGSLENYVPTSHASRIRWLKAIGFHVDEETIYDIGGTVPFYKFGWG